MALMDARMSYAHVRNRAEQSQLETKLSRIDKEKRIEMRKLTKEKQKFRTKYSKQSSIIGPSEVKMFETHTPGFCFRSNGEQKNVKEIPDTPSIDFQHLHYLIFTNGEVDVEKILCLHLLSAHRAETLTPPRKKTKYVCKEHSPTERLIDRSKKGFNNFEKLSQLLPLYTMELSEYRAMGEVPLINDGRLAARILINDKLRELLNTVVIGLEQSNRHKLKQLVSLAKDTSSLRKMLGKKTVSNFLETLYDHSIINSCESYVLTPPFRIRTRDFDIKTVSGNIENLIKHIRQNVLQHPSGNQWKARVKAQKDLDTFLQVKQTPSANIKSEKGQISNTSSFSKTPSNFSKTSSNFSKTSSKFEMQGRRDPLRRPSEEEEERLLTRRGHVNFIAKNIEAAAKTKKIEYDLDDDDIIPPAPRRVSVDTTVPRRRSLEPKTNIQNFLPVTDSLIKESIVEEEKMETNEPTTSSDTATSTAKPENRKLISDTHDAKFHIKHTNCPACMEKWRTPLPSPKTPRVKNSAVIPVDADPTLTTNLQNRISMLINREIYKLESYNRKYSADNEASKKFSIKKKTIEVDPLDNVNLDRMDLAKIEQEIKEKETKKKLEKFLKD